MKYYYIEPEVAGEIGPHSIVHESSGRLSVEKLHYVFNGWASDEILESTPCYIVSTKLVDLIRSKQLSGIVFDDVEVSFSKQFYQLYPNKKIPSFLWMKVHGVAGKDDVFLAEDTRLVISERAWNVLKPYAKNAIVNNFIK